MIKLLKYLILEWEYRPNEWGLLTRLQSFVVFLHKLKQASKKKGDEPQTDEGQQRNGCFNTERWKWKPNKKFSQGNGG